MRSGSTVGTFGAENQEAPREATDPDPHLIRTQLQKLAKARAKVGTPSGPRAAVSAPSAPSAAP
ncbi:hypothetical protein JQK87_07765 [Streptomyces sp. G44]|uniref:hypothetical protein n=1 Tax=Streptomyces sp. G44 TaxID=2807632 RepID=UPI00195F6AD1|nr:hypothetical protein [Streptomyces sp. G44]MBM7168308.1 hypothetical protein [Streptomyces sp. G44]